MSRPVLSIHPDTRETDRSIRYDFHLGYSHRSPRETLYYEVARGPATPVGHSDGALCAVILHAMRERLDIRLHGQATEGILRGLREFQLAWSRWLPDLYQPVEIEAEKIVGESSPGADRSIAAFSGGVDSLFTLFSHNAEPHQPPETIAAVLMVHGFDVALANQGYFDELVARTAQARDRAGASLRTIKTNSKELNLQNWEHSFAAELAACMHFCSAEFSQGFIASSEPYDALLLPWGSNPVTDHLLSGGWLRILHDGAGFSRTDKLAFLARFPEALRTLKVCWEGEDQARNCGVCEKCVRTRLNFLAVGVTDPPCFEGPLDLRLIRSIRTQNTAQLAELRSICEYAEQRKIDAEWLRLLRARVRRGVGQRTVKGVARATLERAGLLGAASRLRGFLTR